MNALNAFLWNTNSWESRRSKPDFIHIKQISSAAITNMLFLPTSHLLKCSQYNAIILGYYHLLYTTQMALSWRFSTVVGW